MPDSGGSNLIRELLSSGIAWVWFVLLAVWGGTVNYIKRRRKDGTPFSLIELTGEWTIAGFAGVVTGLICMHYEVPLYLMFAIVAISGHAGGRAIEALESKLLNWIPKDQSKK